MGGERAAARRLPFCRAGAWKLSCRAAGGAEVRGRMSRSSPSEVWIVAPYSGTQPTQ